MVSNDDLEKLVAQMRALGVTQLETPTLKLTLTAEAPPPDVESEPEEEPDETPFRNVHEHPDTYGGYVPWIKRDKL